MPKVSQQYRDARRAQILDAAKRCFLRHGFRGTSMQQLFAEAGLSSGAFYGYFASKEDVVLAVAEENLLDVASLLRRLAAHTDRAGLGDAVAAVLTLVRDKHRRGDVGSLAVLVWAEALRDPRIAERQRAALARMRADLAEVVRRRSADTTAGADPDVVAGLVTSVVSGYLLQLAVFGEDAVVGIPEAVRTLWAA
ncbi:transcriptional regulator, TetR family [Jatrophihabitans endophyticus]|uniref:Transcriptional regulator, TetR family n=1 Tax=Jatrophihabitans endophyticus TaxID=1206085 RepID=A0A1M5DTT1_9ACTN|nr:TetR/AcrR family transcriptional regulator [Jatrophihabitans endophyticus]SHF70326.1 transcriptional regulator, TetR family [Jatrophihabitans endophyticus]